MDRAALFALLTDKLPGVWNIPGNIAHMDAIITAWEAEQKPASGRTISPQGVALIREFEGLELKAYPDPGSGGEPWTIGIGTTIYPDGRKVRKGDVLADAGVAEHYLKNDLRKYETAVNDLTGGKATQNQHDALVSFAYNVGPGEGGLKTSTLLRLHNEGHYAQAAEQFKRWNRASGKVMAGLTRRREAEAKLYRGEA